MRIPFIPTILEHAASTIGVTPSAAACDGVLMAEAHIQAWKRYRHGAVTVGIDVYNAEAEALGCEIRFFQDNSVPGIISRPGDGLDVDECVTVMEKASCGAEIRGRLPMLLKSARQVKTSIGGSVPVGLGVSGPFSICCEWMGFENCIMTCITDPAAARDLMQRVADFLINWCRLITKEGIGITLFESWAAPPLLSPKLYHQFAAPWEKTVIDSIIQAGGKIPTLVIGGDTSVMLDDMISTGTGMIVCDYNADMQLFVKAAQNNHLRLRGNIDPKLVASGSVESILNQAKRRIQSASGYPEFVLGTGVLPYDTSAGNIDALSEWLRES